MKNSHIALLAVLAAGCAEVGDKSLTVSQTYFCTCYGSKGEVLSVGCSQGSPLTCEGKLQCEPANENICKPQPAPAFPNSGVIRRIVPHQHGAPCFGKEYEFGGTKGVMSMGSLGFSDHGDRPACSFAIGLVSAATDLVKAPKVTVEWKALPGTPDNTCLGEGKFDVPVNEINSSATVDPRTLSITPLFSLGNGTRGGGCRLTISVQNRPPIPYQNGGFMVSFYSDEPDGVSCRGITKQPGDTKEGFVIVPSGASRSFDFLGSNNESTGLCYIKFGLSDILAGRL